MHLKEINSYRKDINGLRGIAVIAVIINHVNKDFLQSGYLGVDIFFVISGFVITSSIFNRKDLNIKEFFFGFYERRIKRLVPALIIFNLITSFIVVLVIDNPGYQLRTSIASLVGISNIYLFSQSTDYFASSVTLNPFLHTWSLSIEAQFYMIFPFLAWFTGFSRSKRGGQDNFLFVITFLSILSFIFYIYLNIINPSKAYFLLTTRFWEISFGCIIFLLRNKLSKELIQKKELLVYFLFFTLFLIFIIPQSLGLISTVFIVLNTGALILLLNKEYKIYALLTSQPLALVGSISYSLYLWHWGILTLSQWTVGVTAKSLPFLIVFSFVFSLISYKLIEVPFAKIKLTKIKILNIFFGAISLLISSITIYSFGKNFKTSINNIGYKLIPTILPSNKFIKDPTTAIALLDCHLPKKEKSIENCLESDIKSQRNLYIIGDSHAANHFGSIIEANNKIERNYNVKLLSEEGLIQWLMGNNCESAYKYCNSLQDYEVFFSNNLTKNDLVIFSLYRSRINEQKYTLPRKVSNSRLAIFKKRINKLAEIIISKNAKLLLVDDIPLVCSPSVNFDHFIIRLGKTELCQIEKNVSLKDRESLTKLYKELSLINSNIIYVDFHNDLCSETICTIFDPKNNNILYGDSSSHFLNSYSSPLKDEWEKELLKIKNNFK